MPFYKKMSLLTYIFLHYVCIWHALLGHAHKKYGRGLTGRAGCRQTEVQTEQTDKQTDDLCLLRQRIGEHLITWRPLHVVHSMYIAYR